jgi:hypothetical protein
MAKIKVRLKAHHHFYIHNDIGNAAFYFKNRVDERIAKNDHDGVGLEIMAGLTLLAFEAEARFNFLGAKLITGWNEGGKTIKKIKAVCRHLEIAPNFSVRPYSSLEKLKTFRDTLAHGKPVEKVFDQEVVATAEELRAMGVLHADYEVYINQAFFHAAYEDVELIWKDLLTKSGMNVFDTLTGRESQMTFIENVEDGT